MRQNLRQREERRLQDGVGALAHADLEPPRSIALISVKLDVVGSNVALGQPPLHDGGQALPSSPLAVDQEHYRPA